MLQGYFDWKGIIPIFNFGKFSLLTAILVLSLIGDCATWPENFDRPESYVCTDTDDTRLAKAHRDEKLAHPGHSGFLLLGNGLDAFVAMALGRSVKVEDKIVITTSLQPYLSLEGLQIGNPKGFRGLLLKEPYTATVEIGSLRELLEENRSWMEIKMVISKTRFDFAGAIDLIRVTKSLNLKAAVSGDRLDSLNGLLNLDMPPLQSYRVGAQLTLQKQRAELSDFVL